MEAIINFNFNTDANGGSSNAQTPVDFTSLGWRLELLRQYDLFPSNFIDNFHHIFLPVTPSTPFVTPDGAHVQHWIEHRRPGQLNDHEQHLYENCFLPWVKELKAGHAGLEKNVVADLKNAQEIINMERLIMVTVVDPASVIRHHCDDEQLMRFQLEYWAQTAYVSGRRIAPMRKKRVSSQTNSSIESYEEYQRTLNSQGDAANFHEKAIQQTDESGVNFQLNVQHDGMDMEG